MSKLHGIRSFEGLRAESVSFGEHDLKIACLSDIIKSMRAAARERDLAVLDILEKTLHEQQEFKNKKGSRGRTEEGK
jgi:hypothetical protein